MNIENINNEKGTVVQGDVSANNNEKVVLGVDNSSTQIFNDFVPISFRPINLASDDSMLKPQVEDFIVDRILSNRILIVQEVQEADMHDYLYELVRKLSLRTTLEALELVQNEDHSPILKALKRVDPNCIFLMNDVDAEQFQYQLEKLISISRDQNFFVIVSTNSIQARWVQSNLDINQFWFQPNAREMYNPDEIVQSISKRLTNIPFLELDDTSPRISESQSIDILKGNIYTPIQLELFLHHYSKYQSLPSDKELSSLLGDTIGNEDESVSRWFKNLKHEEKLMTIGLVLFDGVLDSQFFEAIGELVKDEDSFWKKSAPSLAVIDYKDLDFLIPFLHLESSEEGNYLSLIQDSFRRTIFQTLWHSYRRHLLIIFPKLVELLRSSYQRGTINWELFGTSERRALLRESFTSSLSDLTLIDIKASEYLLLELALSDHKWLQKIAGKSLARWRTLGKDAELFQLLSEWQTNPNLQKLLKDKLERRKHSLKKGITTSEKSIDLIKSTCAITLAEAAKYDKPNQLNSDLIQLYIELAKEDSLSVRKSINSSLGNFVSTHALQLQDVLFDVFLPEQQFHAPVGEGLGISIEKQPISTKELLENWFSRCVVNSSDLNRRKALTRRDEVISIILECWKNLDWDSQDIYTKDEIFEKVKTLLNKEGRVDLRKKVLELLIHLIQTDSSLISIYLDKIQTVISKADEKYLVELLGKIYLEQRMHLVNEDGHKWEHNAHETTYAIWPIIEERPSTEIELIIFDWVNSQHMILQRIGTLCSLEFAKILEEDEHQYVSEYRIVLAQQVAEKVRLAKRTNPIAQRTKEYEIGLGIWLRIKIFFYMIFESKENRKLLKFLLKLLRNNKQYSSLQVRIMNHKWKYKDPIGRSKKMAKWLSRFY